MYHRYDFSNPAENQVSRLQPHPLNDKIYGASKPDPSLLKSIREHGIFNPVVVNKKKQILSGTRRWLAAKEIGFKSIPVLILLEEKGDGLLSELFLIESNRARIKSQGQFAREASELLRIETELAKQRRLASQNNNASKAVTVKSREQGEAVEIVGKKLGIGEQKVRQAVAVVRAAEDGDVAAKRELRKLDRNETTVNAAYLASQKTEKKKQKTEQQKLAQDLQKLFGKKAEVQSSKEGKFNVLFYKIDESEVRRIAKVI